MAALNFFHSIKHKYRRRAWRAAFARLLELIELNQKNYDVAALFGLIGAELNKLGLNLIISVLDDGKKNVYIRHLHVLGKELSGMNVKVPLENIADYAAVLNGGAAGFNLLSSGRWKKILVNGLGQKFNLDDTSALRLNSITAPLKLDHEIIGFFEIIAEDLRREDVALIGGFVEKLADKISHIVLFQEIKKSEKLYHDLFANAKEGFFIMDLRRKRFVEVNQGLVEITGYTEDELKQMNLLLLFHIQERENINRRLKDWLELPGELPEPFETKAITKAGLVKYIKFTAARIINQREWFCIIYDRTEKILSERALKRSQISLAKAQSIAHIGSWDWDLKTNALAWSDEIYRIFGLRPQQFGATYDAFLERVHPDDRETVNRSVEQALKKKKSYNIDHRIIMPDGGTRIVHEIAEVKFDHFNRPARMQGTVQDVTARRELEEKYKKLSDFNQRILDTAPLSIITIDKNGALTYVNKYFENFSASTSPLGRNVFELPFFINEGLCEPLRKLLLDGSTFFRENCRTKNLKGETKYLNIIQVPLKDGKGEINGALSIAVDNTETYEANKKLADWNQELEKKVAERTNQLQEMNRELARILDLKTKFIADASHELRTPLTIIQLNMDLARMRSQELVEQYKDFFEVMGKEVSHMTGILSDLTALARGDAKEEDLVYAKVDLSELVKGSLKSLEALALKNSINLSFADDQAVEIMGDQAKLEKLFLNILRNAIKYNKPGGAVKIWLEKNHEYVKVFVADSGLGIAEKDLPYIFERFYRSNEIRGKSEGSGLGLAICKAIAQAHGGEIKAESQLGQGSIFTINLPVDYQKLGKNTLF